MREPVVARVAGLPDSGKFLWAERGAELQLRPGMLEPEPHSYEGTEDGPAVALTRSGESNRRCATTIDGLPSCSSTVLAAVMLASGEQMTAMKRGLYHWG